MFSSLGEWEYRNRARKVAAPTLVVQGRQDRITPPAGAEDWAVLLPDGDLLCVPEAGHVPLQERPELVWPAVERFLDAWTGAAAPAHGVPPRGQRRTGRST